MTIPCLHALCAPYTNSWYDLCSHLVHDYIRVYLVYSDYMIIYCHYGIISWSYVSPVFLSTSHFCYTSLSLCLCFYLLYVSGYARHMFLLAWLVLNRCSHSAAAPGWIPDLWWGVTKRLISYLIHSGLISYWDNSLHGKLLSQTTQSVTEASKAWPHRCTPVSGVGCRVPHARYLSWERFRCALPWPSIDLPWVHEHQLRSVRGHKGWDAEIDASVTLLSSEANFGCQHPSSLTASLENIVPGVWKLKGLAG